jgi:hypothetical protein
MSKAFSNLLPVDSPLTARWCQCAAWSLSLVVCLLAILSWGHDYNWQLLPINNYVLFPLLGLLAFSLMWAHYMAGALRQLLGLKPAVLSRYFKLTSSVVLVLLFLHPGLLIYQRFRDGFGLPPHSYESYVAPGLGWVTLLGTVSWLAFMAFEFRRFYGKRSWWHFVTEAGDAAMLAIVYHGLRLGHQLHGWFLGVWWFYAAALVMVLINKYYRKYFRARVRV